MTQRSNTIRLFINSLFSDLKAERDALQREVFPRFKQLVTSNNLRLRSAKNPAWGKSTCQASQYYCALRLILPSLVLALGGLQWFDLSTGPFKVRIIDLIRNMKSREME